MALISQPLLVSLRLACCCGATLHMWDTPLQVSWAREEWLARHQGEGHAETDYVTACQNRLAAEDEALRAVRAKA